MREEFTEQAVTKMLSEINNLEHHCVLYNLARAWNIPPALDAARRLHARGITSKQVSAFGRSKPGHRVPAHWVPGTVNEMRDLECIAKEKSG